jgi:LysR family transcriptional regulator, transcriptional activator of nhaA
LNFSIARIKPWIRFVQFNYYVFSFYLIKVNMRPLNFHHLHYFWAIANEKSLTRAAEKLHVSQSALSIQLRQLEEALGHALFDRQNRALKLTEAGRIALSHADAIFRAGDELRNTLDTGRTGRTSARQILRVGSVATLSRNFQFRFLQPLMARTDVELVVRSGSVRELTQQLRAHTVDVVLANQPVPRDADATWHSHLLAEQAVSLVSRPPRAGTGKLKRLKFPADLADADVVLPGTSSDLRAGFDRILDAAGIRPRIIAEVDDMAMLRLIARATRAITLVPAVVVRDELKTKILIERCKIPELQERFYAITPTRRFPNPLVRELLEGSRGKAMF